MFKERKKKDAEWLERGCEGTLERWAVTLAEAYEMKKPCEILWWLLRGFKQRNGVVRFAFDLIYRIWCRPVMYCSSSEESWEARKFVEMLFSNPNKKLCELKHSLSRT